MPKFNHCFIFENGIYREIPYTTLFIGNEKNPEYKDRYFLPLHGCLMEVTYEDYQKEYREKRRQKYIREEAILHEEVSCHALDTDELNGEETIPDTAVDVEEQAIQSVMVECLHKVLTLLSEDERWLVDKLYFQGISQSDLEKESGISQQVISYRNKVVLRKLKNLIKK